MTRIYRLGLTLLSLATLLLTVGCRTTGYGGHYSCDPEVAHATILAIAIAFRVALEFAVHCCCH